MAKRSTQRRSMRSEKNQLGCMWSLISIFDFRSGRLTRKLLSDKRHGSRHTTGIGFSWSGVDLQTGLDDKCHYVDFQDDYESKPKKADNGRTSVKKFIEEDTSGKNHREKQNDPSTAAVEEIQVRSDSSKDRKKLGKKTPKESRKTYKVPSDHVVHDDFIASTSLGSLQESYRPNSTVVQSSHNLDLASVMEHLFRHTPQFHDRNLQQREDREREDDPGNLLKIIKSVKQHNQLNELYEQLVQKHTVPKNKSETTDEVLLNDKFINNDGDTKQLVCDCAGAIYDSNQLIDALDVVSSNKELFLELLQNQNVQSLKHMQEEIQQNAEADEEEKVKPTESPVAAFELSGEEIENSTRPLKEERTQFQKQKYLNNYFFRRKVKSRGGNVNSSTGGGSDSPQVPNRIVVLKPSSSVGGGGIQTSADTTCPSSSFRSQHGLKNEGHTRRDNSKFSFTEIKKKLKHAIGESRNEKHLTSADGSILRNRTPSKHCQGSENVGERTTEESLGGEFPIKTYCNVQRTAKPSSFEKGGERRNTPRDFQSETGNQVASSTSDNSFENLTWTIADPKRGEYEAYEEAKKHLAEMLSTDEEGDGDLSNRKYPRTVPRILGGILSLADYDYNLSPLFSPGRDKLDSSSVAQTRFSTDNDFQIISKNVWRLKKEKDGIRSATLEQNLGTPLCSVGHTPDTKLQAVDLSSDISKELYFDTKMQECTCSSTGDSSLKGITANAWLEGNMLFNEPIISTQPPIPRRNQSSEQTIICEEQGYLGYLRPDSSKEHQTPSESADSFSSSNLPIEIDKAPDDGLEDPIPEPHFLQDVTTSPEISALLPDGTSAAEPPMQPVQIHFEDRVSSPMVAVKPSDPEIYLRHCKEDKMPTFEYIRAVLQASGLLCWDVEEYLEKFHSSSEQQLLDPSLFDEVEVVQEQLCSDRKLVFDCITEVLLDFYECYFGSSPWVSFVKPNSRPFPVGNNIVHDVCERIDWHLGSQQLPQQHTTTLDQIVGKDMVKAVGGAWIDLRSNTEAIGIEMGDIIFDDLMEETLLELSI